MKAVQEYLKRLRGRTLGHLSAPTQTATVGKVRVVELMRKGENEVRRIIRRPR